MDEHVYSETEISGQMEQRLPLWFYRDGHIQREYHTSGWKSSMLIANTVGHLAEAAWHHPDLVISYSSVTVRLMNHSAKGITEKDFQLAQKIEEVVHWQPKGEGTALNGTPDNPRYAYIKYDS